MENSPFLQRPHKLRLQSGAGEARLHLVQQRLTVTVQGALQRQVIAGMVHAEHASLSVDMLQEQLRLFEHLHRAEQGKLP